MEITLGRYIRYSDFKKTMIDNFLTNLGQKKENHEILGNEALKPVSQESIFTNLPAVKLSISEEGIKSWRETIRNQQVEETELDGILMEKVMISYETLLRDKMVTANLDLKKYTLNNRATDLVEAYGKLYDEIVQGHKNGQRKPYVIDPTAEDGLRRVTLEEELTWLDDAFKNAVDSLESTHTYLQKVWNMKIDFKGMKIRHTTGAEREALLREKAEYEYRMQNKALENALPENTKEKLTSAVQEFISQYLSGNGRNVSQILANIKSLSEFRK